MSFMDETGEKGDEKPYHHGNLREALVDAALGILEREEDPLTLRAAAKAVGVSHTAPYNHFPDKEALLAAVAIRGFSKLEDKVETARTAAGADPAAQLAATGEAYIFFAVDHPALFRLMFGPRKQDGHSEEVRAAGLSAFEPLVRVMREGMEAGTFHEGDVQAAAFTAWSLVHGMAQLAIDRTDTLTPEDREGIAARFRASHAIMMQGLAPR
jgi:AcrR family transcriptional regulator